MTDAAPEIDLRPDGTATLVLATGTVTLRRPTIGELRTLEESLTDANDSVGDAWRRVPAAPLRADAGDEFARLRSEYREAARAWTDETQRRYTGWFRHAVTVLGNGATLPEADDELPPWAGTGDLGARLLVHWTTVPLPVATR